MRNQQRQLYATFGVAFLLTGCGSDADPTGPAAQAQARVAAAGAMCQKWLKVSEDNDPHLDMEERFRISGPNQDGDYRLRPIGSGHQVLPKDHPVLKAGDDGFEGEIEIQGEGHGQVTLHFYTIVMEFDNNGCPSKLTLETKQHEGDAGIGAHGGDAEMD